MNTNESSTSQYSARGRLGAFGAICLWSAGNIIVREVPMDPIQIAFWRILLSAVVYRGYLAARGRPLRWDHIKASAPAGIAISLEIAVFFVALKETTVANATVIGALQPLVLLGVASRRFNEVITRRTVLATLVAMGGVALVVFGSSDKAIWSPRGDLLAFAAMLLFAAYFALAKTAREHVPAFEMQTSIWIVGSITLLPLALVDAGGIDPPSTTQWKWLIALLIVPATGHFLINWAHSRVRLSVSSLLTLLIPVLSSIGAAIFVDESIVGVQVIGMALVLSALIAVVLQNADDLRLPWRTQAQAESADR